MKKFLMFFVAAIALSACGGDKEEVQEEVVELKDFKDRLSYVLGSVNAKSIVGQEDPNVARLDMNLVAKGFESNLNDNMPDGCEETLMKLFGPYYQDFDSTYAAEGAECLGKLTAYAFYRDMKSLGGLEKIDLKMVVSGFRHGLMKKDTLVADAEKQSILQNFIMDLNVTNGKKMMAEAKKKPGVQVFENGIVMEVIQEGKGGNPGATDDVKVEYILTSATGDTIQSSYDMKKTNGSTESVALKLNGGVIPGWSYALPKMKKGGKYRLWVPWELAYGEQMGKESLCFFIELVDYAKEGTFVKPEPMADPGAAAGF